MCFDFAPAKILKLSHQGSFGCGFGAHFLNVCAFTLTYVFVLRGHCEKNPQNSHSVCEWRFNTKEPKNTNVHV